MRSKHLGDFSQEDCPGLKKMHDVCGVPADFSG